MLLSCTLSSPKSFSSEFNTIWPMKVIESLCIFRPPSRKEARGIRTPAVVDTDRRMPYPLPSIQSPQTLTTRTAATGCSCLTSTQSQCESVFYTSTYCRLLRQKNLYTINLNHFHYYKYLVLYSIQQWLINRNNGNKLCKGDVKAKCLPCSKALDRADTKRSFTVMNRTGRQIEPVLLSLAAVVVKERDLDFILDHFQSAFTLNSISRRHKLTQFVWQVRSEKRSAKEPQ